jgi:DNA-binding MarR family transcriptional regulator
MSKIKTPRADPAADALHRALATAIISFHEKGARRLGMSAAERKALGILDEFGVATAGQLAQATGLTTGAITGIVDRLEKAGFARREPNPKDRRSVLIRALQQEKVRKLVRPMFESLSRAVAGMRSRYTPKELAAIDRYLADTTQVLRQEIALMGSGKH